MKHHNKLNEVIEGDVNFLFALPVLVMSTMIFSIAVMSFFILFLMLIGKFNSAHFVTQNYLNWNSYFNNLAIAVIAATSFAKNEVSIFDTFKYCIAITFHSSPNTLMWSCARQHVLPTNWTF